MDTIGKDFKYKIIPNFLEKNILPLFLNYCTIKHLNNFNKERLDTHVAGATTFYGDPLMESLLISKKKLVEKITNKKLYCTYSYWRMYTHLDELTKHTDRESCEISLSINIGSSGEDWPIYMDGEPNYLKPGDAIIYLGREIVHHRDEFKGDWFCQVFIHYVDANGPYADFNLDKRITFGRSRIKI